MHNLPISIQTFEKIRAKNLIYVDKTALVYNLVQGGKYYFLSRPRRFGKSLLLTTLKSFFEGKKELFKGLVIYEKEQTWTNYPVVHIDYSFVTYWDGMGIFKQSFLVHLQTIADKYDIKLANTVISSAFTELIIKLHEKYQQKVVVLIDEYDKPLVDTLGKEKRNQHLENRQLLRGLYTTIKGLDAQLRFVMLTGVSRFSKVSVFSGMNNLDDISMNARYSTLVGFTQTELEYYFKEYLQAFAQKKNLPLNELLPYIQDWYNGFSFDGVHKLYNPFSVLKLFTEFEFRNYWFSTGTPTFLIDLIKRQKELPENLESIKTNELVGASLQERTFPLVPLLYQTGYLTIKKVEFDDLQPYYYLGYPNREVRQSFITHIAAAFKEVDQFDIPPDGIALRDALKEEDIDFFIKKLQSFLSDIPARLHIPKEAYYHSLTYLILRIIGFRPILEKETDKGRIDAILELPDKVYIIEFKFAQGNRIKHVTTLSRNAIKQIEAKRYFEPYLADKRRLLLLGVGFLEKQLHGRVKELKS